MAENLNVTNNGGAGIGLEGAGTPTGVPDNAGTNEAANGAGQQDVAPKTYTEEEFNKALQAEADKRVQQALKTSRTKMEAEIRKQIKDEQDEAARFAKMNAEEKAEELRKKNEADIEKARAELSRDRLVFEAEKELDSRGLPTEFAADLCGEDADATKSRIDAFEKRFNSAVESGIDKKMRGRTPNGGAGGSGGGAADPFLQGFNAK